MKDMRKDIAFFTKAVLLLLTIAAVPARAQTFSTPLDISMSMSPDFAAPFGIALDDNSNINVIWDQTDDIYFARSNDGGVTFSVPTNVSDTLGLSRFAQLAVDGSSGDIYVVWQESELRVPGFDLFVLFSRSTDGGATFSTPNEISANTANAGRPRLVVDGSGNINVVWIEALDVLFSRSTDGGATFSSMPENLSDSGSANFVAGPRLAVDGSGNIFVTWLEPSPSNTNLLDVFFSRSTDGGATFSMPPTNFSDTQGSSGSVGLAVDGSGNMHVVWSEDNSEILFKRFTPGVLLPLLPTPISTDGSVSPRFPQVAVDVSGNINVIWQDSDEIFFARSTDGTTFSSPINISNDLGLSLLRGRGERLAVDGIGNINVIWDDFSFGDILLSRSTDGGTTFSSAIPISDNVAVSSRAHLALDSGGNIYVVWTECIGTALECEEDVHGPPQSVDVFFSRSATPQEQAEVVMGNLEDIIIIANPGTPLANKVVGALASVETALDELAKEPPDNPAAVGNIEGAVGDLCVAIVDEGLDPAQGSQLMDQLTEIARQLAVGAINEAIAQSGDPQEIVLAQEALAEGDALRDVANVGDPVECEAFGFGECCEAFKEAVNKYKDALAKAEGALP